MGLFNTDIIKDRVDHFSTSRNTVTVTNMINANPEEVKLDLYSNGNEGYIYTSIHSHLVYIKEFSSKYENRGYGKNLFGILIDYIYQINKIYPIEKIYGFMPSLYIENKKKLIYFYSHLSDYINNSNNNVKLEFKLRNYELSELKEHLSDYNDINIYFDFFITYP